MRTVSRMDLAHEKKRKRERKCTMVFSRCYLSSLKRNIIACSYQDVVNLKHDIYKFVNGVLKIF